MAINSDMKLLRTSFLKDELQQDKAFKMSKQTNRKALKLKKHKAKKWGN